MFCVSSLIYNSCHGVGLGSCEEGGGGDVRIIFVKLAVC